MFSVSFACPLSRSARVSSPMAAADGTAVDPTAPQNTAPFPEAPFPDVMAVAQDLAGAHLVAGAFQGEKSG
jgi:hypothetical protein